MRFAYLPIAILLIAIACSIAPAYCATIYVQNDFNQANYTAWVGQAVYDQTGITLLPDATEKKAFIENINFTPINPPVYVYYRIEPVWTSEAIDQTFEVYLKQGNTQVNLALVYYPTSIYKFRVDINGTKTDVLINQIPNEGIFGWDGSKGYLYDTNGNLIASIATAKATGQVTSYGFIAYGASVILHSFIITDDLTALQSYILREQTTQTLLAFVPVIISIAMLGVVISMLNKYV